MQNQEVDKTNWPAGHGPLYLHGLAGLHSSASLPLGYRYVVSSLHSALLYCVPFSQGLL